MWMYYHVGSMKKSIVFVLGCLVVKLMPMTVHNALASLVKWSMRENEAIHQDKNNRTTGKKHGTSDFSWRLVTFQSNSFYWKIGLILILAIKQY